MSKLKELSKGLKSGEMKFQETAGMYSVQVVDPRHGGDSLDGLKNTDCIPDFSQTLLRL